MDKWQHFVRYSHCEINLICSRWENVICNDFQQQEKHRSNHLPTFNAIEIQSEFSLSLYLSRVSAVCVGGFDRVRSTAIKVYV